MNFESIETYVKSISTASEQDELILKYYVTSAQTAEKNTVYGIKVESLLRCPCCIGNASLIDFETTQGISHSLNEVRRFMSKLVENSVTPTSLLYVADDFISAMLC